MTRRGRPTTASHDAGFDVVGDVHGQAAKLRDLLVRMDYEETAEGWHHPERTAVFVGDLVDRGPEQVAVYEIARAMVAAGAALAVMGNHEFNAVAYATPDPDRPDAYLRGHSEKNRGQHQEFLDQVGWDTPLHREMLAWFRTLPLWREVALDGGPRLRVVHACWDAEAMATVPRRLTADVLVAASREGSPEWQAVEHLVKGPEVPLPDPYEDKDGNARHHARYRWWDEEARTLDRAVLLPDGVPRPAPVAVEAPVAPYTGDVPVVFGHYWRTGEPVPLADHAACVDYSAGKDGPLVAYRWSGESVLTAERFATSSA